MPRKIIISLFILVTATAAYAQEVVTGLVTNLKIRSEWEKSGMKKSTMAADTIVLPFFDDFSGEGIYPDAARWQDNYVFINNSFTENQRTQGVATFDALDNSGRLYETAASGGFEADHLTSVPIDLSYTPDENIYLSFLYEPGGISDPPEAKDSLTLQFFAPTENKWYSIWRTPSAPADTFSPVIIHIVNSRFLKNGFRLRFVNYASLTTTSSDPSLAANCDIWNLDYVLLGKNRNNADTLAHDVAFTKPVRSTLNTYESMPWKQFKKVIFTEMGDYISIHYLNNDKITRNVTRDFEISDVYRDIVVHTFSSGAANIAPSSAVDYNADLLYNFNTTYTDSALFRIKCFLKTDIFDPKENDTIIYYQKFGSYFAFDDGTAEGGYGVNGLGSKNAMVAYRYQSFLADSLRAVQICFNDSYQNSNLRDFDLMVWRNNSNVPGEVMIAQEEMTVKQGTGINGFYTYYLNDPIEINGEFFVGWKQRSETFLNAGFDINTPHNGRQLYWLNGNWNVSQALGSIMIRPVFGPARSTTGLEKNFTENKNIRIWPNPASDYVIIDNGDVSDGAQVVRVTDLGGKELIRTAYYDRLDISFLSPGVYFIILESKGKPSGFARLIKSR